MTVAYNNINESNNIIVTVLATVVQNVESIYYYLAVYMCDNNHMCIITAEV